MTEKNKQILLGNLDYIEQGLKTYDNTHAKKLVKLVEESKALVESLALPQVIDCDVELVVDPIHGKFDIQLCGGCKNGPITNEVFCPICGCKIGRRCL